MTSAIQSEDAAAIAWRHRDQIRWLHATEGILKHIATISADANPTSKADLRARCGLVCGDINLYAEVKNMRPPQPGNICRRCAVSYVKAYAEAFKRM